MLSDMTKASSTSKDFRNLAQGFGVCTIAVLALYLFSGMDAINLREANLAFLMTILMVCCVHYVVCAFVSSAKRFCSLIAAVPVFPIYYAVFKFSFDAANRNTLSCINIMESVMFWAGIGTIIVSVIVLLIGRKFEAKDAVTAVLGASFVLRAVMVLFTPLNYCQHDVSNFSPDQAGFHDTYIMFIYENFTLPAGDVRDLGQFYHPPLHYILSAVFLRIQSVLPMKFAGDINGLKCLPMLWTSYLVLFAKKILERFEIKGKALALSLVLIAFCPQMIFLSIQVNNDALALMLFVASFFIALKWYSKPELTTILLLAISVGCAMMTKLSMGFVAFPIAFLFLVKLVDSVKGSKDSKQKKKDNKLSELVKQFVFFAVVVFPLGLWFPLKNMLLYGTPVTYVYVIDSSAGQDVWMYSLFERLFVPSKEILQFPFLYEGGAVNDFNIPLALMKTSLFDERDFTNPYMVFIARVLLVLALLLMIIVIACAVIGAFRRFKKCGNKVFEIPEYISLWILAIFLVIPEYIFCFKYPVVCTQAFRYIAPVLIPAAIWSGSILKLSDEEKQDKLIKAGSYALAGVIVVFALFVILFYGPFAEYSPAWERMIGL